MARVLVGIALGAALCGGAVLHGRERSPIRAEPTWTLTATGDPVLLLPLGEDGWRTARGTLGLRERASIHTSAGSEATLARGANRIVLAPSTRLSALRLEGGRIELRLDQGSVLVMTRGAPVRLAGRAGQLAECSDGDFRMTLRDSEPDVRVERGEVEVSRGGDAVTLTAPSEPDRSGAGGAA